MTTYKVVLAVSYTIEGHEDEESAINEAFGLLADDIHDMGDEVSRGLPMIFGSDAEGVDEPEKKEKLYIWTKRLGQRHYAKMNSSETFCGRPMLGNSYASVIPKEKQKECEECLRELRSQGYD